MTTPKFHRLREVPGGDYVRADPTQMDWINNDPAAPLTQAPADEVVTASANPCVGSRFVAGKEDAVDVYANRPHRALSEDIDQLDEAIRRGVVQISRVTWSGGSDTYTFPSSTRIWTGDAGMIQPYEGVELVMQSVDNDVANLVTSVGTLVKAISWDVGSADPAGFSDATSVTFNETVPGGSYYIYYGTKMGLAEMPRDAVFTHYLHGIANIAPLVQRIFQKLHGPLGSPLQEAWNDEWDTTIAELGLSGLNERYRRSLTADYLTTPSPFDKVALVDLGWPMYYWTDTPGAGGWILRSGMAPTVVSKREAATPLETDKLNACWRTVLADDNNTHGGSVGVAVQGGRALFGDTHQLGPGFAATLVHKPNRMENSVWYSADAYTNIPDGTPSNLSYDIVDGQLELTCELNTAVTSNARFFKTDTLNYTGITTGMDTLEVYDDNAGTVKYWLIHRLTATDKCVLRSLNGDVAPVGVSSGGYDAPAAVTTVYVTWHQMVTSTSDGAAERQLSVACVADTYEPGYQPLPSPFNYGTVFMAAYPWLGLQSTMPAQTQHFDASVVSIFGSVYGDPTPDAEFPHPDIALQIGARASATDLFGQTPPSPFATFLSNGTAWLPRLHVDELDCYDKLALIPGIHVNTNLYLNDTYWASAQHMVADDLTARGTTAGLSLYSKFGDVSKYLNLNAAADTLTWATSSTYMATLAFAGLLKRVMVAGGSGNYFNIEYPVIGAELVNVSATTGLEVDVDPTTCGQVIIDNWSIADTNANLQINLIGANTYNDYVEHAVYRLIVRYDVITTVNTPGVSKILHITFVAGANAHLSSAVSGTTIMISKTLEQYGVIIYEIHVGWKDASGVKVNLDVTTLRNYSNQMT